MFTGIIQHRGRIERLESRGANARLVLSVPAEFMRGVEPGDSIACDGICLTALLPTATGFAADVSLETLRRTTLGQRRAGDQMNLEQSLRLGDKLGGHLVTGHVDAVGRLLQRTSHGESVQMRFALPPDLAPLIAHKGSVAVDGISLTPTDVTREHFDVWLIRETLSRTSLGGLQPGGLVNLEADLLSRYVARQLALSGSGLSAAGLEAAGWGGGPVVD